MITANLYSFQYRNFQFRGNNPFVPQPMYRGERPLNSLTKNDEEARIASYKAKIYGNTGDWAESIKENKKALSVCEEKDYIHKASINANMGLVYAEMGRDDNALLCFYEATKFYDNIVSDYDEAVKNYRAPAHRPPKPIEKYTESLAYNEMRVGRLLMHKSIPQNIKRNVHKGDDPVYYFKKAYNRLAEIKDKMDEAKYKDARNYCVKKIIDYYYYNNKLNRRNDKKIQHILKKWANKFEA